MTAFVIFDHHMSAQLAQQVSWLWAVSLVHCGAGHCSQTLRTGQHQVRLAAVCTLLGVQLWCTFHASCSVSFLPSLHNFPPTGGIQFAEAAARHYPVNCSVNCCSIAKHWQAN